MNKIKKIIIIVIVIIILLLVGMIFKEKIIYISEVSKIENNLKNYLNFKSTEGMTEERISEYDYYIGGVPRRYNISEVINVYFNQLMNNDEDKKINSFFANDRLEIKCNDYSEFVDEKNISIYEVEKLLEKILIHENEKNNNEWYIDRNSKNIIELPYNYYIKYTQTDREDLYEIKEVTKVKLIDKVDFEDINKNGYIYVNIEYKDFEDKMLSKKVAITIYKTDDKILVSRPLYDLYYTETQYAKVELCNHDYDEWKENEDIRMNEELAAIVRNNEKWLE